MNEPMANAGAWPRRNTSSAIDFSRGVLPSAGWEAAFLLAAGVLAVALHAGVHWPLKLPGHHGLEWMALLMFARVLSAAPWAAVVAATSAAVTSCVPWWGFHESTIGLSYLLSGVAVDVLWRLVRRRHALVLAIVAALAHATKPLWKLVATAGWGLHFGSIAGGAATAVLSHLMFGLAGGLAGALAGITLRGRLRRP